jgi:formylglycine-generating enzyme required for sulfatase activity
LLASCEEEADREPPVAVGDIAISNENPFLNLLIQPIPEKDSYAENLEALRVRVDAIETEVFKGVVEAAKSADPVGELSQARADLGEAVKLLQSKDGHEPGRCAAKLRESIGARRKELESKVVATGQTVKDRHMKKLNGIEVAMEKLDGIDKDLSALSSLTESLEGELKEIMELYVDTKSFDGETAAKTELLEILTEKEKEWFPDTAGVPGLPTTASAPAPLEAHRAPMSGDALAVMEGTCAGEVRSFGGIEMVWCPPGEFLMGSPEDEADRNDDETQHRVTLTRGFWMAKKETTQGQWESLTGENPSYFNGVDLPGETVSWEDVQGWLAGMNQRNTLPSGWKWDLPTEAQWEYACRAGTETAYAGTLDTMAWCGYNSGSATNAVGTKKPNAWGLYDMHGNVWEWCADFYGDYGGGAATDPTGPGSGSGRVVRGGSWGSGAADCRSAGRNRYAPGYHYYALGFRPAAVPVAR